MTASAAAPTIPAASPLAHAWGEADEDTRRLREVLVPTAAILALATIGAMLTIAYTRGDLLTWILMGTLGLPIHVGVIILARHGRGRQAAILLCAHTVGLVWALLLVGGPNAPRLAIVNIAIVVLGWLLSERLTVAFAVLSCALLVGLGLAAGTGHWQWPVTLVEPPHASFVRQTVIIALIVAVMRRGCDRLLTSVRSLEARSEGAIEELRRLNEALAQVVDEQTLGLVTTRNQAAALATEVVQALEEDVEALRGKLLHATSAPIGDARCFDDVQLASRSAERLAQMVDNLATYARLGEVTLHPVPIDMAALATEVVAMLRATADGGRVAWRVDPLPAAFGDQVLIRSVLENLVANAVKFSRRERQPRVHVGYDARKGRYYVQDNGVGFDPSGTNRLFAPFCRLHDRKKFEGQGMGLANVRHIVERHYGSVEAEGEPGRGATFSFSLPSGENWC